MGDDILDIHKYLINKNEEWDSIKCLDLFLKIFYSNGGGNFNTVNDPYAKLCLPNVVKNINVNAFNLMSRTNEARYIKCVSVSVNQMQVFVIINKNGMKINADVNAKNWLRKVYVIKDLFGILAIVNVINHVMLENI